jgi:uncharacterized protein YukE
MKTKILYTLFFILIVTNCNNNENNEPVIFLPELTTEEVTNLSENSATIKGIINDNGSSEISQKGITWSTTSVDPDLNDNKTEHGSGNESFSSTLENLQSGTTYYARAYATNEVGTNFGKTVLFQTHSGNIELSTSNALEITEVSAKVTGTITNDENIEITEKGVCWSSTSLSPTISDSNTKEGNSSENFTSELKDLKAGTNYYARTYATTKNGTSYGNTILFQTVLPLPTVTTKVVSNITQEAAQTGGNIEFPGNLLIAKRGICWATTTSPTLDNSFSSDGTGSGEFTSTLSGLTPNTTYYLRAYAINSEDKIAYGNEVSFKTLAVAATLTTTETTDVNQTTAKSGGNITDEGGETIVARGVCWSTNPTPNIENDKSVDGEGSGVFESELTNLLPSTTYYVRAYATNSEGTTAYGNEVILTTLPADIVYPENGFYGANLLHPSFTEAETLENPKPTNINKGQYSFTAILPKGTSLKIVLTALEIERGITGFPARWSVQLIGLRNWFVSGYDFEMDSQTFEAISDGSESILNIWMNFEPKVIKIDYYENGADTPTRTKVVTVK